MFRFTTGETLNAASMPRFRSRPSELKVRNSWPMLGARVWVQDQVGDHPLVDREVELGPPVGEERVEPALELGLPLRLEQHVAGGRAGEGRVVAADRAAAVGRELLAEERLVAGLAEGPAELDLVHVAEGLDEAVRDRRLGVEEVLPGVAVVAGPVGADAGREQEPPIHQQQLLLAVEPEVPHRLIVLKRRGAGGLVGVLLPAGQVTGEDLGGVEQPVLVLHAGREGGLERSRGGDVGPVAVEGEVEVPVGGLAQHRGARLAVVGLVLQLAEARRSRCPARSSPPRRWR